MRPGKILWIKPFTGWPLFGWVKVLDPEGVVCTPHSYKVRRLFSSDTWWMDANGAPNNYVSPSVYVPHS